MKLFDGIAKWLPTVVAICGLISLYAFWQLDSLVHETLYEYGLQFNDNWATPYWTFARTGWAMSGIIVVLALASQIHLILRKPAEAPGLLPQGETREEDRWNTFRLGDGSTIKVKLVVKGAKRLNKFSADGMPIYTVETEPVVRVVEVPESLRVPPNSS